MRQTQKNRQSPEESATLFKLGTIKKGNDGNKWIIIKTNTGIHRWKKTTTSKTQKKRVLTIKSDDNKMHGSSNVSHALLVKIAKKYYVTTSGSKKELAEKIWRVRRSAIDSKDLERIAGLLSNESKKDVNKIITERIEQPVLNYRGMWKKQKKPLNEMKRTELLNEINYYSNEARLQAEDYLRDI